jgi:hypothetical protein
MVVPNRIESVAAGGFQWIVKGQVVHAWDKGTPPFVIKPENSHGTVLAQSSDCLDSATVNFKKARNTPAGRNYGGAALVSGAHRVSGTRQT